MISLKINKALVTPLAAEALIKVCPFSAITYEDETLDIGAGCRMCKLCVKKGPEGVVSLVETHDELVDKSLWNGVCVYAEAEEGTLHPVTFELIGKARELAAVTKHEVYALLIGHNTEKNVKTLLEYGVDRVYVYDYPEFADFVMLPYSNAFEDFIERVKPSSVLVGATNVGRSLAPRIAARFRTGLTADCTVLEMYENTDLVQIRPAFGGNLMATIICPRFRPSMATVRPGVMKKAAYDEAKAKAVKVTKYDVKLDAADLQTEVVEVVKAAKKLVDLVGADYIVSVGRGISKDVEGGIKLAHELADVLGGVVGGSRVAIDSGWLTADHQVGQTGKTVHPKVYVALGISGSIQHKAGMSESECIIAVNKNDTAPIFEIADYGICGDLFKVTPMLIEAFKAAKASK
mgnify:FL=1